jgi:hypothetical protein
MWIVARPQKASAPLQRGRQHSSAVVLECEPNVTAENTRREPIRVPFSDPGL